MLWLFHYFTPPPRLFFLGNPLEWVLYCNSPFPIELPTVPLYLFTAPNNSHQQHNYLQIFITRNYFTIFSTALPRSLFLREGREGGRTGSQDLVSGVPLFSLWVEELLGPLLGPGVAGLRVSALLFRFGESRRIEAIVWCLQTLFTPSCLYFLKQRGEVDSMCQSTGKARKI